MRERVNEIPKDKKIILLCTSGNRSFECQLIMREAGIENAYNIQGGTGLLDLWGIKIGKD